MSDVAICVENLGKMYHIGGKQERYQTFRDTFANAFLSPFKKARALLGGQAYGASNLSEDMWALKDVSFEIKQGEVIGIIGRNGAGKSTLLKILSRITEPTTGYVDIFGRVGALLEVGTGFHPELTGRENIYLNGTILGMGRKEIDRKFDEIVDFSGVEKFIDTPVKHFSSGMGLRLGFAVAAHLEPDILIVDEVLAVGDAEFQKKCIGKMSDVASQGRTVLFVSHNMGAINSLCSRTILLNQGRLLIDDSTNNAISAYLKSGNPEQTSFSQNYNSQKDAQFLQVALQTLDGEIINGELDQNQSFNIVIDMYSNRPIENGFMTVSLRDSQDIPFMMLDSRDVSNPRINAGTNRFCISFPSSLFAPGQIYFTFALVDQSRGTLDVIRNALQLDIVDLSSIQRSHNRLGYFALKLKWDKKPLTAAMLQD